SVSRSPLRRGFLLIPLLLGCFGLSPSAQAVLPAPDGGYLNGNTAEGDDALFSLTTGGANTALGFDALYSITSAFHDTATGYQALYSDTASNNTATGYQALYSNTTAIFNTADGVQALFGNTEGSFNTASGHKALYSNTTGNTNTATGVDALYGNTTGYSNTADGTQALFTNTTGVENTANGVKALHNNTTGNNNTATGVNALYNNTTGNSNIALGINAGQNLSIGDNNIDIGNTGVGGEANTIRIGTVGTQTNAYVAGIYQATVAKGVSVVVDSMGHLGTKGSSARFKDAIQPMDKASEAILALKPVTFHYKKELDPEGIPQFGLVAEEVAKVNPDLVAHDAKGEVYTVRYDAV